MGSNRTGKQWFGNGPNDFIYVAHPSYWSRYEVGTNLVYVFFFSTGNVVLTMESIQTYSWVVRDGDVSSGLLGL